MSRRRIIIIITFKYSIDVTLPDLCLYLARKLVDSQPTFVIDVDALMSVIIFHTCWTFMKFFINQTPVSYKQQW